MNAHLSPSDDVGDDVAEAVLSDLLRPNFSVANHRRHQGMVVCQLIEPAIAIQIRSTIPHGDRKDLLRVGSVGVKEP